MTDGNDHHDDLPEEFHSDGELSEDSLFEWDGTQWVSVEHDPFYGFDEPQEWIEPPRQIYPPPRPTRLLDPDELDITPEPAPRWFNFKVVAGVLIGIVALALFLNNLGDGSAGGVALGPTLTPSNTPIFYTPTPTLTPTPVATALPPQVRALCDGAFSSASAFIFVSGNSVVAQSMTDASQYCTLVRHDTEITQAQLAPDDRHVFFTSERVLYMVDLESDNVTSMEPLISHSIDAFDIASNNYEIAYVQYRSDVSIFNRNTNSITRFWNAGNGCRPGWSPDRNAIMVACSRVIQLVPIVEFDRPANTIVYQSNTSATKFFRMAWAPGGGGVALLYRTVPFPDTEEVNDITLMILNRDGSATRELATFRGARTNDLAWLPDQQHIAVLNDVSQTITVYDLQGNITDTMPLASP